LKIVAVVLALVFILAAVIYVVPGGPFGHHPKHSILFGVLALLSLLWLRFQSAGTSAPSSR
jgi:hypothetical protein